ARGEVRKVVWPTRREAAQVTLVVIVMVILAGLYMWLLDAISFYVIYDLLLGVRES
ncbi:MAG: preprotein translocase subunit SecE, partial [Pseudomonadota bacterium]|nr:preprotein translocase subunit SecE [Pseudomonadota bacterium]